MPAAKKTMASTVAMTAIRATKAEISMESGDARFLEDVVMPAMDPRTVESPVRMTMPSPSPEVTRVP